MSFKDFKNVGQCLLAPFLTLVVFYLLFEGWNLDFTRPIFIYESDSLYHLFLVKNIIDSGWFFSNDLVGLPHIPDKFYIHDFGVHSDFFNFVVLKCLSYFSKNVFLVTNLFFILTFVFISLSSYLVLRKLKMSYLVSLLISILFAFTPYHLYKSVWHIFLSNYMVIPFVILIALWILDDKSCLVKLSKEGKFYLSPNKYFYYSVLLTLLIASSGVYYAIYSAIIFVFAWFIYSVRKGYFINHNLFGVFFLGCLIICVLITLYIPALTYWAKNGLNNFVGSRHVIDSNIFGLKIANLFSPVQNHYVDFLASIRGTFDTTSFEKETSSESLGILAASGFMFLLLWLLIKGVSSGTNLIIENTNKKLGLDDGDKNLISNLSSLNILIVLYATVGGFVIFVSMAFPLLRSHARFSIFIAFISLILVGIVFDKIINKKGVIAKISVVAISVFALFDQVGVVSAGSIQNVEMMSRFESDRDFVESLEKDFERGKIFVLPVFGFPESSGDHYRSAIGYIHSKNLKWSYPVMKDRASHSWQNEVVIQSFDGFVVSLKEQGFDVVMFNEDQITNGEGITLDQLEKVREFKDKMSKLHKKSYVSRNKKFIAYEL